MEKNNITYGVILPILNQISINKADLIWTSNPLIQLSELTEIHVRLITEYLPEGFYFDIKEKQSAFFINNVSESDLRGINENQSIINDMVLGIQLAFDIVSSKSPIIIPFGVITRKSENQEIIQFKSFNLGAELFSTDDEEFIVDKEFDLPDIIELYSVIKKTLDKSKNFEVTAKRFCSAMLKKNIEDKLIDLTIALESMLPGKDELRYRFSSWLAIMIEKDLESRKVTYQLLKNLYDARSELVHGGDPDKKCIKSCQEEWDKLVKIAKRCIFYKMAFESKESGQWDDHLSTLVFGGEYII